MSMLDIHNNIESPWWQAGDGRQAIVGVPAEAKQTRGARQLVLTQEHRCEAKIRLKAFIHHRPSSMTIATQSVYRALHGATNVHGLGTNSFQMDEEIEQDGKQDMPPERQEPLSTHPDIVAKLARGIARRTSPKLRKPNGTRPLLRRRAV